MTGQRFIVVELTRRARKYGGDKYESPPSVKQPKAFVIYIPWYISRPNGFDQPPVDKIKVTFEVVT